MTQPKISELTTEQIALLSIIWDEWSGIGLDTAPTDKRKAEEAIALPQPSTLEIANLVNNSNGSTYIGK
jgi:hypothetical protein